MSSKKTLIWALVLVVLAGFYYLYEIEGGKKRQEAASQRELLVRFAADDVTGLTLKREAEVIRATRRDGHWYLSEPLAAPGDDQKYGELVRSVAELRHTRLVEEQPASLEPFGLATPQLEVQVTLKDQTDPLSLRLGTANPTGGGYYTQVEGRSTVYLVSSTAKDVLNVSLHDLRDKTVFAFATGDVHEVQFTHETDATVTLQRQEAETWRLTTPVSAKADDQYIRGLLQRLRDAKVQAFIEETPATLEPYGLQTPSLQLTLRVGQERTEHTLWLGKIDSDRKGVYAKRSDAPRVFLVPQTLWVNLPKTVTAVRDKALLRYERENIARLDMQSPGQHILIMQKAPRQYTLEQPVSAPGDSDAIYGFLWDLRELKVKDFVAETPTALGDYGLETPRLRVVLEETAPEATQSPTRHTLLFGADAPDSQGTYVSMGEGSGVYLVDHGETQKILGKSAFDLRNKKILTFASDQVQKVQVKYPSSQFTVERQGKAWKLIEPQQQAIPQNWKVDHMLYELSMLEYRQIIAETVDDPRRYGFDVPQVQMTLWQQDNTPLGTLIVGATSDTEIPGTQVVYVQTDAKAPVYAVKPEFIQSLPKTAAELTAEK